MDLYQKKSKILKNFEKMVGMFFLKEGIDYINPKKIGLYMILIILF